jgi:hypothetical protein
MQKMLIYPYLTIPVPSTEEVWYCIVAVCGGFVGVERKGR